MLELAHQRGLQSLGVTFTYNDPELALAQATAVFPFGAFTDVGDASPGNTNQKVRAHFRRVAATGRRGFGSRSISTWSPWKNSLTNNDTTGGAPHAAAVQRLCGDTPVLFTQRPQTGRRK